MEVSLADRGELWVSHTQSDAERQLVEHMATVGISTTHASQHALITARAVSRRCEVLIESDDE